MGQLPFKARAVGSGLGPVWCSVHGALYLQVLLHAAWLLRGWQEAVHALLLRLRTAA